MAEDTSPQFTTKRRSIGSDGELQWGGDGESWSDSMETSSRISVTDTDSITPLSAVPDSVVATDDLFAYWPVRNGSGSTLFEEYNGNDGEINGAAWESGNWHQESALTGNSGYVETTSLDAFGSQLTSDFAIGLSYRIDAPDLSNNLGCFGLVEPTQHFYLFFNDYWGYIFELTDANGDRIQLTTRGVSNAHPSVGTKERLIINKKTNTGSNWELHLNGSQIGTANEGGSNSISNTTDFSLPLYLLAHNNRGTPTTKFTGAIDNMTIWTDSLTNTEISTDYANQPWS